MIEITPSPLIQKRLPQLKFGVLAAKDIHVQKEDSRFDPALAELTTYIKNTFGNAPLSGNPVVGAVRRMYRQAGWEPTKYRPSSEALARRILKDKGLYRINNVVDLANIVSAKSHLPMGLYNHSKINGPITVDIGKKDESYQGISRDSIHAEGKIILRDDRGIFGNPTADSKRTAITPETQNLLALFFCPATIADDYLRDTLQILTEFYRPLSTTENIDTFIQNL